MSRLRRLAPHAAKKLAAWPRSACAVEAWYRERRRGSRTTPFHAAMPHLRTTPVNAAIPQIAPTADSRGNAAFTYDAGSPCNAAYHKYRRFMQQCRVHERCRLTRQCCKLRATPVRTFMPHIADIAGARRNAAYHKYRRFKPQCLTSRMPPDCALALERNPDRTWVRHMTRLKPVA